MAEARPLAQERGTLDLLYYVWHPVNSTHGWRALLGSTVFGTGMNLLHRTLSQSTATHRVLSRRWQKLAVATMSVLLRELLVD